MRNWKQDLNVALTAYLPAALAVLPTAFLDSTSWSGALVISTVILLALLIIAWQLQKGLKPVVGVVTILITVISFSIISFSTGTLPPRSTSATNFVTYALFVGVGEEILWRGYIQSRLNEAFGKPYQFFGVSWGLGLIIASAFFGLVHVLNGRPDWYWAWGIWTACNGLLLGFVREKTGSVLAPSFLHGLPFGLGRSLGM